MIKKIKECYLGNKNLKASNVHMEFTEEQLIEYLKCASDPIYFIKNYIKIISLDGGIVPFKLWKFQEKMIKIFSKNRYSIAKIGRQSGKCFSFTVNVKLKNKKTGKILEIPIGEFYEMCYNK